MKPDSHLRLIVHGFLSRCLVKVFYLLDNVFIEVFALSLVCEINLSWLTFQAYPYYRFPFFVLGQADGDQSVL